MNAPDVFPPGRSAQSPCVGICRLTADGASCIGCGRTLDEISAWSSATDAFKRAVWQRIARERRDAGGPETRKPE